MTIRKATLIIFRRYEKVLVEDTINKNIDILKLTQEAINKINELPIDKLSRWLGYIQYHMILTYEFTIDTERNFSRPLFHAAYENNNIPIPDSVDVRK